MATALSSIVHNCDQTPARHASQECAIDLVHLSRQTLGDRALEIELLRLFDKQCEQLVARIEQARGPDRAQIRETLAHTLKGSARAVGAAEVAATAAHYEFVLTSSAEGEASQALVKLRAAAERARSAIAGLLVDN